ncbi:MAG: acetylxylan esterase [Chloroflexota bacterium]
MTVTTAKPTDFDSYWATVEEELATFPIAAEIEQIPLRSTDYHTTYGVRYTGIDSYRLFAYLSIPKGEGPFPTLINLPNYGSVLEVIRQGDAVEKRGRYIIFSPAGRGQRNAERPYEALFPGIFLDGIEDPERYIFRGFVADLLRGVDYLMTRPEVDRGKLLASSPSDLPLLVAALRPEITHVSADPVFFYAAMDRASQTGAYPLEEINDYLRLYPDRQAQVKQTLAYFDPLFFAPHVQATTLLWGQPDVVAPLADAISGPAEIHTSESSGYKDGVYAENWITQQFGFETAIVPNHWK